MSWVVRPGSPGIAWTGSWMAWGAKASPIAAFRNRYLLVGIFKARHTTSCSEERIPDSR